MSSADIHGTRLVPGHTDSDYIYKDLDNLKKNDPPLFNCQIGKIAYEVFQIRFHIKYMSRGHPYDWLSRDYFLKALGGSQEVRKFVLDMHRGNI